MLDSNETRIKLISIFLEINTDALKTIVIGEEVILIKVESN